MKVVDHDLRLWQVGLHPGDAEITPALDHLAGQMIDPATPFGQVLAA